MLSPQMCTLSILFILVLISNLYYIQALPQFPKHLQEYLLSLYLSLEVDMIDNSLQI